VRDKVSKIAAFVFENGAMAQEILFRDLEEEDEVPGLSEGERSAMDDVAQDLLEDWVNILSACREAVWKKASGHPLESVLRQHRTQTRTMKDREHVEMRLDPERRATCGVSLQVWDDQDQYRVHVWVWTQAKYRDLAQDAVTGIEPAPGNDGEGSLTQTVLTPKEGQLYSDIAEQAAKDLWALARPVGEAISKQKG